tara:strand:- start:467 stop:721 length:255 start_codon:yes stop_codon:yes gene_type:complete
MYILALKGKENQGAYSVERNGLKTLYLFVDKDDAIRYARLLEANDYPLLSAVEVEEDEAIGTCKQYNHPYYVVKPDQIVIPPDF